MPVFPRELCGSRGGPESSGSVRVGEQRCHCHRRVIRASGTPSTPHGLPPPAPDTYRNPEGDYYVYYLLAWIQATCPEVEYRDGKKAVENAIMAYWLNGGKNWDYPSTLAAAYAECGDFDQACKWGNEAVDLVQNDRSATADHKKKLRANLELYKEKKPLRETYAGREKG